jgi:hypothetical protein
MAYSISITSSHICGRNLDIAIVNDGLNLTFIEVFVNSQRSRSMLAISGSTTDQLLLRLAFVALLQNDAYMKRKSIPI